MADDNGAYYESDLERTVRRHDKDLYQGDHRKAGLTTRMEVVEERLQQVTANLGRATWLLVSTIITLSVGILSFIADIIYRSVVVSGK